MTVEELIRIIENECDSRTTIVDNKKHINCVECKFANVCTDDLYYLTAADILRTMIEKASK